MKNKNEIFKEANFFENEVIKTLKELTAGTSLKLTGGAVIDILNGKTPKDFDLVAAYPSNNLEILCSNGAKFLYSSKTAETVSYKGLLIQLLKTNTIEFDYTINASLIHLKHNTVDYFDTVSYLSRTLIPTEYAFNTPSKSRECIKRLPKMESKGFSLPKISERSLKSNYKWYSFLFPNNTNS